MKQYFIDQLIEKRSKKKILLDIYLSNPELYSKMMFDYYQTPQRQRKIQIFKEYIESDMLMSEVARKHNLSGQRVSQIVKQVFSLFSRVYKFTITQ